MINQKKFFLFPVFLESFFWSSLHIGHRLEKLSRQIQHRRHDDHTCLRHLADLLVDGLCCDTAAGIQNHVGLEAGSRSIFSRGGDTVV